MASGWCLFSSAGFDMYGDQPLPGSCPSDRVTGGGGGAHTLGSKVILSLSSSYVLGIFRMPMLKRRNSCSEGDK